MLASNIPHRLVLREVSPQEWRIEDAAFATDDSRRLLACIFDSDGGVDVAWTHGVLLASRYSCPQDVLASLERWLNPVSRNTAPTPIPHFAPLPRIA